MVARTLKGTVCRSIDIPLKRENQKKLKRKNLKKNGDIPSSFKKRLEANAS
jgi:hypothetical protein